MGQLGRHLIGLPSSFLLVVLLVNPVTEVLHDRNAGITGGLPPLPMLIRFGGPPVPLRRMQERVAGLENPVMLRSRQPGAFVGHVARLPTDVAIDRASTARPPRRPCFGLGGLRGGHLC